MIKSGDVRIIGLDPITRDLAEKVNLLMRSRDRKFKAMKAPSNIACLEGSVSV
jgi:hypothetical protein